MALGYPVEQFYRLVHSTLSDLENNKDRCAMTASRDKEKDKGMTMCVVIAYGYEADDIFRVVKNKMNKWEIDRFGRVLNNSKTKIVP